MFQGSSQSKRFRFVVAGHGKYEKVAVDDDDYSGYDIYQSSKTSKPFYKLRTIYLFTTTLNMQIFALIDFQTCKTEVTSEDKHRR